MFSRLKRALSLFRKILETRFALAQIELIEARINLIRLCILLGFTFTFAVLFIVTLSTLAVLFLAKFFHTEIILISAGLVFLLLALMCLWAIFSMKRKGCFRFFSATQAELKKDCAVILNRPKKNNVCS
jgi:uncharacterized membrane protein YqjE